MDKNIMKSDKYISWNQKPINFKKVNTTDLEAYRNEF
jgi:hypothetical protein